MRLREDKPGEAAGGGEEEKCSVWSTAVCPTPPGVSKNQSSAQSQLCALPLELQGGLEVSAWSWDGSSTEEQPGQDRDPSKDLPSSCPSEETSQIPGLPDQMLSRVSGQMFLSCLDGFPAETKRGAIQEYV